MARLFRATFLLIFCFGFLSSAMAFPASAGKLIARNPSVSASTLKSYREWKTEKIQLLSSQISSFKLQIEQQRTSLLIGKTSKLETSNKIDQLMIQEHQTQWNLEVANDLSVNDYFVLYLANHPTANRFQQIAPKLSASETAELMESYAKSLG